MARRRASETMPSSSSTGSRLLSPSAAAEAVSRRSSLQEPDTTPTLAPAPAYTQSAHTQGALSPTPQHYASASAPSSPAAPQSPSTASATTLGAQLLHPESNTAGSQAHLRQHSADYAQTMARGQSHFLQERLQQLRGEGESEGHHGAGDSAGQDNNNNDPSGIPSRAAQDNPRRPSLQREGAVYFPSAAAYQAWSDQASAETATVAPSSPMDTTTIVCVSLNPLHTSKHDCEHIYVPLLYTLHVIWF